MTESAKKKKDLSDDYYLTGLQNKGSIEKLQAVIHIKFNWMRGHA